MSMDEQQAFLYDVGGRQTAVAHGARERFEQEHPDAFRLQLFNVGGSPQVVAQANAEEYRKENPGAQPVYLFNVDGKPKAVAQRALGGFLEEARAREQERVTGPAQPKKSVARDLLDVAASRAGAAGLGVATAPGELLGGVAAAVGGVDRSTPQGRAVREHQERGDTWDPVMKMWHPAEAVMTEDKRNWAQRQWDKVRGGVVRANQNFNDALVELGHGLRDWREGTKAAPTTVAGEVAAPVADTAATLGKYALLAPTGLGGAVMGAEGASESLARTEGRSDLSAADKLALAAAGGAANAAIYGAAGARATAPLSNAIASRAGASAASKVVSGGGARMAADALKMGAASVAGDVAAAEPVDWGRATKAAQEGAIIGFASGAASSVPRALEASARETARRMQDPATQLRRMAEAVPPDLAEAGENVAAAAVPESPMDAYARRKAAEANPASDFAGEAGREFLARGAREEGGASRPGEPSRGGVDTPPPREPYPPDVPPTAEPFRPVDYLVDENVRENDAALPWSMPREEYGRPGKPIPTEEQVAEMERTGSDVPPPPDDAAVDYDASGNPRPVPGFLKPEGRVKKGAYVATRGGDPGNRTVYYGEIVSVGPKNIKVRTKNQPAPDGPVYEHVLTFPRSGIVGIEADPGALDRAPRGGVETPPRETTATPEASRTADRLPEEIAHDEAEARRQEAVAKLHAAELGKDPEAVRDATKAVQSAARKEDNARRKMEAALAKAGRGSVRADVAAETPRLAGTARPTEGRETPFDGLKQELTVMMDAGATGAELDAFAQRAEAAGAFATAARARQAAGTYQGTPWSTDGGNWPHEEPPAARASMGDLVTLAQRLGEGKLPRILRRISRRPNAVGLFHYTGDYTKKVDGERVEIPGDPKSGSIDLRTEEFGLTTPEQRADILAKARAQAEAEGGTPAEVAARSQEIYDKLYERAWRDAAYAGPKRAQAVLAHEIGHWIDFLDEGTLRRGNVLGHLAALKKYLGGTLFPTKAAADAAGMPGVSQEAVKAAAKEWGVTQKEARERLTAGADLKNLPEIRREMESLVAWFRQADGAPDYFRKDPAELYAEAFSAWVNYPAEAARRAPEFSELLDGWLEARPEAARALEEFRSGVTQAEARAAKAAGDTTNPAFFAARSEEAEAARWWQRRKAAAAERLAARTPREQVEDATDALRVLFAGPLTVIRSDVMDAGRGGRAFAPENRPLWRAMQQSENTPNLMALWDYRFRSKVLPALGDAPYPAFLEYLKNYRIANERLGPEGTRGRMNLPNPGGTTPGDVTRAEGNAQTSAAAWIHEMQRTQPELYAKLEAGRKALWDVVRNGNDELGGEGSPMQIVRDSPCLSEEQKKAINGNEAFASFSTDDLADPSRPMSSEQQSQWDGIFSQRVGSFKDPGDVLANTFNADRSMISHLARMELALRTVDWYRANKPDMVGDKCEVRVGPGGRKEVVQGQRKGWRTVTFLRDGEPEGWWVKTQLADAIELPGRGERSWDGWMGLVSKGKRALNAAQTSWNPVFNTNNSLAKDPHSLALRLPTYKVRGKGILQGTANALGNVFGHYGSQLASYLDSSGADYAKGRWNPDTARALAWGAVNNAAPGSTAYADTAGGGAKALEMGLRDLGLADQKLGDEARKQLLKARGLTEAQIEAGMRAVDGTLRRVAEAWDRLGKVPRGLRKAYPAFLSWMQHGEIRTKSFALKEILKERPDLSREESVEIARKQIGTPDMANKPVVDRNPLTGFALFQYFTPRMHGWLEQMIDPIVRSGYTGGRKEQVSRLSRLVVAAALLSWPFLRELDLHQTRKDLSDEEERKRRAGDLPGAQRVRERLDEVEEEERYLQSIPTRDKFTKIIVPGVRGKDGNRALGFSVDPTITPLTTALLGTMFGQGYGVGPGAALREGLGTEVLPGFAPAATVAYGLARDFDPNTGRPIGKTVGDRAAWAAEALTGRSLGTGLISWGRELLAPKDDPRAEERKARQDVPVLSAIWRPFWRKTGYGLVEKAGAMRAAQEENNAKKSDISERIVMGRPVSDEEKEWLVRHAANPGESLRAAAERVWKMRNMTPDQRAADSLGKLDRREIEERFHYVAPPRLTEEDRNR